MASPLVASQPRRSKQRLGHPPAQSLLLLCNPDARSNAWSTQPHKSSRCDYSNSVGQDVLYNGIGRPASQVVSLEAVSWMDVDLIGSILNRKQLPINKDDLSDIIFFPVKHPGQRHIAGLADSPYSYKSKTIQFSHSLKYDALQGRTSRGKIAFALKSFVDASCAVAHEPTASSCILSHRLDVAGVLKQWPRHKHTTHTLVGANAWF